MTGQDFSLDGRKVLRKGKISFYEGLNVLVGGNGSGKSSLLESIHLKHIGDENVKIATFSSGQNQNFEENHLVYLLGKRKELNDGDDIFPHSFYFDVNWAPILLVLATHLKATEIEADASGSRRYVPRGYCSSFLLSHGYCLDSLTFRMQLPEFYFKIFKRNNEFSESDFVQIVDILFNVDSVNETQKNFREKSVDVDSIDSSSLEELFTPVMSNELYFSIEKILQQISEGTKTEKIVKLLNFFQITSIDNSYVDLSTASVSVKRGEEAFRHGDLSDGEYQLLCTYAILDIFNDYYDYILLDEVDSHIHFSNLNPLWRSLNETTMTKIITSTHNPISLRYVSPERIKSLKQGECEDGLATLSSLGEIFDSYHTSKRTVALSFRNSETLILIDGIKDWKILCSLFKKVKENGYSSKFDDLRPYPLSSKRVSLNDSPDDKDKFVQLLGSVYSEELKGTELDDLKLKKIICIKDRDNESLQDRYVTGSGMCVVKEEENLVISPAKRIAVTKVFLHRREIENYLLCEKTLQDIDETHIIGTNLFGEGVNRSYIQERLGNEEVLATLDCKDFVSSKICHINSDEEKGFSEEKMNELVNSIPKEEISPYIALLHDYLSRRL